MPYVSEAEKEAARWMSEAQALEHICEVDHCDLAEAQRQLRNAIIDHRDMVYRDPHLKPIMFPTKAEQLRDEAKPKRILRDYVLSIWSISNQPSPFLNVAGAFELPISQPSEHLPQTANSRIAGRHSDQKLSEWYKKRLLECAAAKCRPTREQDCEAAKVALGDNIPREAVYRLRKSFAPLEWQKGGRPKVGQEKCGDE